MHTKTFIFGALTGAAAMYLLDPNNGQVRRQQAQEQARQLADSPTAQKLSGQVVEATRPLHDSGPDSNTALADKVRSEVLGRPEFSDLVINLDANDRTIVLRGVVDDPARAEQLVTQTRQVAGVDVVESYLHPSDRPAPNMS